MALIHRRRLSGKTETALRCHGCEKFSPYRSAMVVILKSGWGACKTMSRKTTSKYKGVYWCREHQRWRAEIVCDGVRHRLGRHRSEEDAAAAYGANEFLTTS